MKNITRRGFLSVTAAAGAALPAGKANTANPSWPGFTSDTSLHTTPFMDQYYNGMQAIADGIRDTQIDAIAEAMENAYRCMRNGGRIFSNHIYGHTPRFALNRNRPGQPWVLPSPGNGFFKKEDYDGLKKNDFVLTFRNSLDKGEIEARDRGVYIAGVTNSYFRFYKTPPGGLVPVRMENGFEDYSNIVIDSQVPWENGLVSSPRLHFKFCPSTTTGSLHVYWACTASLAHLIATNGKGSPAEPAKKYLELACARFEMIGTDRPKIDAVTEQFADRMLDRKGRIIISGRPMESGDTTSGRLGNMFADEATGAAASEAVLTYVEAVKDPGTDLRPEDVVMIGATSSDNPYEIAVARAARKAGALTVSFGPFETAGDDPANRLYKETDAAFNTYSPERAGVLEIGDYDEKICPLTGVTGNLVHWMLTAQWADHMARRGEMPYFRLGMNYDGGEYNRTISVPNTKKRGY
ncbi:twin-arginine translocation signal domain-containing protein [Candidatus Latescibacterota bacterium]